MTTIAEGLRAFILADVTVSGLIGARMYPLNLPQRPTVPAITYQYLDIDLPTSTDGPTGLEHPVFQIDLWGSRYSDVDALWQAVRIRLNGYQGDAGGVYVHGIFLERARDLYDHDAKLHRRTADWSIWNKESTS